MSRAPYAIAAGIAVAASNFGVFNKIGKTLTNLGFTESRIVRDAALFFISAGIAFRGLQQGNKTTAALGTLSAVCFLTSGILAATAATNHEKPPTLTM